MKIDSRISEEKKVRCTGCRIVILLTPDEDAPDGMLVSIPKKSEKPKGMPESRKRMLLTAALVVMALVVAIGIWYSIMSGPPTHATVEGEVTLDSVPLDKGTIEFATTGDKKIVASAGIVRGRYSVRAGIGNNIVKVTGEEGTNIAAKYNKESKLEFNVIAGTNPKNFEVTSK